MAEGALSIREIVKKRLIEEMILESGKADPTKYLTMIMDAESTRIATAALKMYDLCEQRVTAVENLMIPRAPFPELDAIYFISPTNESVAKLVEDFTPMPKKRRGPQYGGAHVFFTSRVPDSVMALVQSSPGLLHHLRTFKEVNIEFLAKESCFFSLGMCDAFHDLFNADANASGSQLRCVDRIVEKLVTVFASLGEYPIIRYPASSAMLCTLANKLENGIRAFMQKHEGFKFRPARGTVLLLDRATDPVAPLMHECTYQAMVQDLMPPATEMMPDGKSLVLEDVFRCTPPGGKDAKTIVLDESDEVWLRFRHMHMAVVMKELDALVKEFERANADIEAFRGGPNDGGKGGAGGAGGAGAGEGVELSDMGKVVKKMADYQKQSTRYSAHVDFVTASFVSRFMERGLMDVTVLEQNLATGINEYRKVLKLADAEKDMERVLAMPVVSAADKVRLVALFAASQATFTQEHNAKFVQGVAGVGDDESSGAQDVLRNLRFLGIDLGSAPKPRLAGAALKAAQQQHKAAESGGAKDAMHARYEPVVKDFIDSMVAGDLPWDQFPAVVPPPEAAAGGGMGGVTRAQPMSLKPKRAGAKAKAGGASSAAKKVEGPRIVVFMAGGATYSEIRSCYRCREAHSRDVLMGATHPVTPGLFLRDLKALGVGALSASGRQVSASNEQQQSPLSPSPTAVGADDVVVDVM